MWLGYYCLYFAVGNRVGANTIDNSISKMEKSAFGYLIKDN
jgi:hypothetical protein